MAIDCLVLGAGQEVGKSCVVHFLRNLVLIEKLEQLDLKSVETVVDEKVEDKFGYFKVPGKDSGMKPIVVKAKLVSKIAEKKIEMGGAVVLTA
ncbi:hypothetical protein ACET3Z_011696 [Daucus carota]